MEHLVAKGKFKTSKLMDETDLTEASKALFSDLTNDDELEMSFLEIYPVLSGLVNRGLVEQCGLVYKPL